MSKNKRNNQRIAPRLTFAECEAILLVLSHNDALKVLGAGKSYANYSKGLGKLRSALTAAHQLSEGSKQ